MKDTNHGPQAFSKFWWRRHHPCKHDSEDVDGSQAQKSLDSEGLEDFGPVVIQFVGKSQDGLEQPNNGHGETLHGASGQVFPNLIGNHNHGVQDISEKEEEALFADQAVQRNEHWEARNYGENIHDKEA